MQRVDWGLALALGFGTFKATDVAKEVFDRVTGLTPQPYLKSVVATGLALSAAAVYAEEPKEKVLLGAAVAGIAAVLHEAHVVLVTQGDANKVVVVERAARAAASSVSGSAPGRRVRPL